VIRIERVGDCGSAHLVVKFVSQTNLYSVHFWCQEHKLEHMMLTDR